MRALTDRAWLWGSVGAIGFGEPTGLRPTCLCRCCVIAGEEGGLSGAKGGRPAPSAPAGLFFTLPTSAPTSQSCTLRRSVWKATRSIALKKPGSREDDFLLMVRRLARQKIRGKPRGEAAT